MDRFKIVLKKSSDSSLKNEIESKKEESLYLKKDAPTEPHEQAEQVFANLVRTPEGRVQLATSFITPIQQMIEHKSLARRFFSVDPIRLGRAAVYDRPSQMPIYIIGNYDHLPQEPIYGINKTEREFIETATGNRFVVPFFECPSDIEMPINQVSAESASNAMFSAADQIANMENRCFFNLLDAATGNSVVRTRECNSNFLRGVFGDSGLVGRRILMSARSARSCGVSLQFSGNQLTGTLLGAQVSIPRPVPENQIYIITGSAGVLPILTDITILPVDSPVKIGWSVFEVIGMACYSQNISKISIEN